MQSLGEDSQLPHKKMKTLFLSNMSKSRRLTSTFFPIIVVAFVFFVVFVVVVVVVVVVNATQ